MGKFRLPKIGKDVHKKILSKAKDHLSNAKDNVISKAKDYASQIDVDELFSKAKDNLSKNNPKDLDESKNEPKPQVEEKDVKVTVDVETNSRDPQNETNEINDSSSNQKEISETEKQEEQKIEEDLNRKKEEKIQKIRSEFANKRQKAKDDYDKKVERINKGPPGFIKFFTSGKIFILLTIFDSLMDFPGGFIISGLVCFFFYAIPVLLMGNLGALVLIFLFYTFDGVFSFVLMFLDLFLAVGYVIAAALDAIPEIIAYALGLAPYQLLAGSVESFQAKRLRRARRHYEEKMTYLQKAEYAELNKARIYYEKQKSLTKKAFLFFSKGSVSLKTQKIISVILLLTTFILSTLGLIGIAPILNFSIMGIVVTLFFFFIIFFMMKLQLISDNFVGYVIMLVAAWLARFLLTNNYLSVIQDIPSEISYLLLIIFATIYALHEENIFDAQTMVIIYLLLVLLVSAPFLQGYFSSDRWHETWTKQLNDAKAQSKNFNLWDSLKIFFKIQRMKGSGQYINGEKEQTHKFIGVRIQGITPNRDVFYSNEPVSVDIDYSANSLFPITIYTSCNIKNVGGGTVDNPIMKVSKASPSRVRCSFNKLPKGNYIIDVSSMNNFESTVRVPLKFMDSNFIQTILTMAKDSGTDLTPEKYVGGTQKPITSPGPIEIGVSNTVIGGVNKLKMPIEVDSKNNLRKQFSRIKFQIHTDLQDGKIAKITKAEFNLPEGLKLENCDFISGGSLGKPKTKNHRWLYDINSGFQNWEDLKTVSCDLSINPNYRKNFVPPLMHWSPQTLFLTLDYEYLQTKSTGIEVKS